MRMVMGIVAGIVVAFLCVFAIEWVGHGLYPPPPGLDLGNPEDQARLMEVMPFAAKAIVLVAWFVGAFAGAATAYRISGRGAAAWVVALVSLAAGVATMMMIPHPAWMWVAGILLPLVAAWAALRVGAPRRTGTA